MADYETLEKLIADLGEPALMLNSKNYKTPERRGYEDVCDSYAIYFHESASGGCIAYGKTNYGWVMNPSLRFPVCALMKMALESKEREAPELELNDDGVYIIGETHNIYGGAEVKNEGDKYYWQVSCEINGDNWQEIPKYLYVALMTFEAESRER